MKCLICENALIYVHNIHCYDPKSTFSHWNFVIHHDFVMCHPVHLWHCVKDIHTENISIEENLQKSQFFSTNTVKKIKAVGLLMDNFNYIYIPLMINIYPPAKPKAVSAYKVNWYCFLALCDNIYYLDDYLQIAYYCCWSESLQTCTFSFYTVRQTNYTENT